MVMKSRKVKMKHILLFALLAFAGNLMGQKKELRINGEIMPYMIDECGDTLILATLDDVQVSSFRQFSNKDDYRRYRRYRQYAIKVYPYAVEAIKVFREVEYATNNMNKKERRKHNKELHKKLKKEFTDPLKKLTKTQGLILIKMIEKEVDTPLFFLIKDLRNGVTASYWGTVGKLYGHDLKEGYIPGKDKIMDAVLDDLDISHELTKN